MLRITESLALSAVCLAGRLDADQFRSVIVPHFLPLYMESGRVQGIVQLKRTAALGGLGTISRSTLPISPRNEALLYSKGLATDGGRHPLKNPAGCGFLWELRQCVRSCRGGAIGSDGVNVFRCRNISPWIPAPLVPAATWRRDTSPALHTHRPVGCPSWNHAMRPLCDSLPVFPRLRRCKRTDKDVILPKV